MLRCNSGLENITAQQVDVFKVLFSSSPYLGLQVSSPRMTIIFKWSCISLEIECLINRSFPSCFEPHYKSEAKCKAFGKKISFHSHANKTNFYMKSFALSLAFILRLETARTWPIAFYKFCFRTNIFIMQKQDWYEQSRIISQHKDFLLIF